MDFREYLSLQLELHPAMQAQDIAKMCYQGAYGPAHLLENLDGAKKYFLQEYEATAPTDEPLIENISDDFCRINIGPWKKQKLSANRLFHLFAASAVGLQKDEDKLLAYLAEADAMVREGKTSLDIRQWQSFLEKYQADGMPAVHHSRLYRETHHPAYRVVSRQAVDNR